MSGRLTGKVAFIPERHGDRGAHTPSGWRVRADILAVDIAGKLPPCVPYDPATSDDLAATVKLVQGTVAE